MDNIVLRQANTILNKGGTVECTALKHISKTDIYTQHITQHYMTFIAIELHKSKDIPRYC